MVSSSDNISRRRRWRHSPSYFPILQVRVPAMTWRADLRELSDNDLLARLRALPRASGERAAICEILVERYTPLVRACVRPYRQSPEPVEDLMQVGYVGLLKAISNFDPAA